MTRLGRRRDAVRARRTHALLQAVLVLLLATGIALDGLAFLQRGPWWLNLAEFIGGFTLVISALHLLTRPGQR